MGELGGRWAVVTGASSGLGSDFARELAARGANVVLVARRKERLEAVAAEVALEHGVETRVVPLSLSAPGAAEVLAERLADEGIAVDVLVNNAGFGLYGPEKDHPWEREQEMLQLDVVALVHLTRTFLGGMLERGRGWILQVASVGAYQPSPNYTVYAAAKAFVLSYGEALAFELRGTPVKMSVLSPGVTRTEFLEVSGQTPGLFHRATMMESRRVVRQGVDALLRGKPSHVPGLMNKASLFSLRFLPRRVQAWMASRLMDTGPPNA